MALPFHFLQGEDYDINRRAFHRVPGIHDPISVMAGGRPSVASYIVKHVSQLRTEIKSMGDHFEPVSIRSSQDAEADFPDHRPTGKRRPALRSLDDNDEAWDSSSW
jgi:hypothetical protein